MAQQLIQMLLCDIDMPEKVEGVTRYDVIDGKLMAMEICHAHRASMNDLEREEIFKKYARVITPAELGREPSINKPHHLPGTPSAKKSHHAKAAGTAVCPVCGKNNLYGNAGDIKGRGIIQHVRQSRDDAHKRAYEYYEKFAQWPDDLPYLPGRVNAS